VPAGLVILGVGCAIAWAQGVAPVGELRAGLAGFYPPIPNLGALGSSFQYFVQFLPVILPMGIINLVLSLQNIESAEAAGDKYEARPALLFNGLGSLATAAFGSPFPTTIYIGHPGWKKIGARAGYSTANAIIMGLICLTGTLSIVTWAIPIEAGMAILIWIGVMMCSQAFSATPREHTPAVVLGLIPALGAFAAMAMRNAFAAGGFGSPDKPYAPEMLDVIRETRGYFAEGVFALDQGYIYTCMILAAATVAIIERKFRVAAVWFLVAAFLSFIGFIHTYRFVQGDVIANLFPFGKWLLGPENAGTGTGAGGGFPWEELKFVWGYLVAAAILFVSKWVTEPNPADEAHRASPDSVRKKPPQSGGAP
jgi:AGZA family xanthine/uracil permease-like MFS transporter